MDMGVWSSPNFQRGWCTYKTTFMLLKKTFYNKIRSAILNRV